MTFEYRAGAVRGGYRVCTGQLGIHSLDHFMVDNGMLVRRIHTWQDSRREGRYWVDAGENSQRGVDKGVAGFSRCSTPSRDGARKPCIFVFLFKSL